MPLFVYQLIGKGLGPVEVVLGEGSPEEETGAQGPGDAGLAGGLEALGRALPPCSNYISFANLPKSLVNHQIQPLSGSAYPGLSQTCN